MMLRRRLRRVLAALVAIGGLAGIAAASAPAATFLPACTPIPGGTCKGDLVNVFNVTDAGPDPGCTACLQTKSCCEAVGLCEDDPTATCVASVKATHACVLEGGAPAEARCLGMLKSDASAEVYECMRSSCGVSCGVPSCTINTAVTLIANPGCDRCIGSACCQQINDCYNNRACKLVVQCITDHCPNTFGPSLTAAGELGPDAIDKALDSVCHGGAPAGIAQSSCFGRCLENFAPTAAEGGTVDDQQALCLSFGVFACGARNRCGPSCAPPPGSGFSGNGIWPEDEIDSGAPPAPRDQ